MGYIGSGPTRFNTADDLTVTGDAEFNGNLTVKGTTTTIDSASVQTIDLGDNDKIRLGDSDDLQVYHDGSNSFVLNTVGELVIRNTSDDKDIFLQTDNGSGSSVAYVQCDGSTGEVKLNHYGSTKITTSATGVDVTGGLNTTGNVGIGTASPDMKLHIAEGSSGVSSFNASADDLLIERNSNAGLTIASPNTNSGNIAFADPQSANAGLLQYNHSSNYMGFWTNAGERLRIDSSGNVGIGTTSPLYELHIEDAAGNAVVNIESSTSGYSAVNLGDTNNDDVGQIKYDNSTNSMQFTTNATERMRIDGSGSVLVGTTDTSVYNNVTGTGVVIEPNSIQVARSGGPTLLLNRQSSNGEIQRILKDGTVVGSIGTNENTDLYIAGGDTGLLLNDDNDFICPATATGAGRDNAVDLGYSTVRWDDVYATNGTIQTSDANEKQQIAALTDVEITAAKAISQLFKTFKWNDSVAEKGDAARTHAGVIAQDVEAAMTAAGLDAGDYAFFISGTWWETQTEVPAVEAVDAVYEDVVIPAVLDEDGNEVEAERTEQRTVTEAVEAVAAYTRTDTYDTAEEAPDSATERTRMGIRYPELLAFIGAATEQRLSNIETRIAALETA